VEEVGRGYVLRMRVILIVALRLSLTTAPALSPVGNTYTVRLPAARETWSSSVAPVRELIWSCLRSGKPGRVVLRVISVEGESTTTTYSVLMLKGRWVVQTEVRRVRADRARRSAPREEISRIVYDRVARNVSRPADGHPPQEQEPDERLAENLYELVLSRSPEPSVRAVL